MHHVNSSLNKSINVTGVTKQNSAIQLALEFYRKGWVIKVRRIKGRLYLYARRYIKEKKERVWKYLSPITEKEVEVLKEAGVLSQGDRKSRDCNSSNVTCVTSVPHSTKSGEYFPLRLGNNQWGTTATHVTNEPTVIPERILKDTVILLLKLKGYYVVEEKTFSLQRIDIYAEKEGEKLVIEVESNEHNYREGLRQLSHVYVELGNNARYILVLPTANENIKERVMSLGFELWTVNDIVREFCKVGDSL